MFRLFKQNTIGQAVVIGIAIVVLWLRVFVNSVEMSPVHCFAPIYELIYDWMSGMPRLSSAIALLLVLAEGVWINHILTDHKMTKSHSLMPMFVYVLVMSWNANQLTLTPFLLVNLVLLATASQLLSNGGTQLSAEQNFNASFFIGIMVLCYLPAICYIVPFIFVFNIYKLYRWRNIIISIFGLIAPFILLFTYAFLTDKLDYYLILMGHDLTSMKIDWSPMPFVKMLPTLILLLMIMASLVKQMDTYNDRTIQQRINTGILSLPLLASLLIVLYTTLPPIETQTLALPFAFIGTRFFMTERKRRWVSEIIIWVFIICAVINNLIM